MLKKILQRIYFLFTLNDENAPLAHRMFLTNIVIGTAFCALALVMSIVLNDDVLTRIICFILTVLAFVVYYLVRFKNIIKPLIIPGIFLSLVGIFVVWINGGGMNSQNILPAVVIFISALIIVPRNAQKYFLVLFVLLVGVVYGIQYYYPQLIKGYSSEQARFIDSLAISIYCPFCIYLMIRFIYKHYLLEKSKAEQSTKKLEQLIKDKDRYMQVLAHDLKSPFNSILGFSQLLLQNVHQYDSNRIEHHVQIINRVSFETYVLLEDLLLWSKSQSGKLQLERKTFDVDLVCTEIVEKLHYLSLNKQINITILPSNGTKVFADLKTFKTIVRNLVSNAIKFTNIGGSITISTQENEGAVVITVSDTGIGMAKEKLSGLFDADKLESTQGTAAEEGTGFGLLLCREFVEKHQGKIWASSEVDVGSSFSVLFPCEI